MHHWFGSRPVGVVLMPACGVWSVCGVCVCACVCVCVCVCACACVRACMRVREHPCVDLFLFSSVSVTAEDQREV